MFTLTQSASAGSDHKGENSDWRQKPSYLKMSVAAVTIISRIVEHTQVLNNRKAVEKDGSDSQPQYHPAPYNESTVPVPAVRLCARMFYLYTNVLEQMMIITIY